MYIFNIQVGDNHYIKNVKPILDHYIYVHCGVEILSRSKRIMNADVGLGEDLGIMILYTDTDSMHMNHEDVEKLGELFKQEYNRHLIGDDLSQFDTDFELKGA